MTPSPIHRSDRCSTTPLNRPSNSHLSPMTVIRTAALLVGCATLSLAQNATIAKPVGDGVPAAIAGSYGRLPLSFEANAGQAAPQVRFTSRGQGYSVMLADREAVLALSRKSGDKASAQVDVLRMKLDGAANARVIGTDELPGKANYFIGRDQSNWHTDIATYGKVKYEGVYPGIDLVYYGSQRQLEYDFVVAPHADAKSIRLRLDGAQSLRVEANGDLAIAANHGEIEFHKPIVYQERDGLRETVAGNFELLAGNTVAFQLGGYDHSRALVIDPALAYSTYLGGTGGDQGKGIAVDSSGSAYIVGSTGSTNFPLSSNAIEKTNRDAGNSGLSVFVTKLNAAGNALVYSTYLGGSTDDEAAGIAVDPNNNAYVTGMSESADYPVTSGAFQTANGAAPNFGPNAFVSKISATGNSLVYSTFLGGNNYDFGTAIAVDSGGHAYVTGFAGSINFPITPGAYQTINSSGAGVFVTKLFSDGTGLGYSTFIAGGGADHSKAIAVSSAGNAYVAGNTESSNYPTTNGAFQRINHGESTGFVTKMNTTGSALTYSTFLGGSSTGDVVNAIALDASGNAYLGGQAVSTDFPIVNGSYKTVDPSGSYSGFVTKMNTTGTALVYSTYLGGTNSTQDFVTGVAVDSQGHAFVTGQAGSTNFPTAGGPYQTTNKASGNNTTNAFVTEFNKGGTALLYSSYFGGNGNTNEQGDVASGIAIDRASAVYLTGTSYSTNFPIKGAYQSTNKGPTTGTTFVSKFIFAAPSEMTLSSSANPQASGVTVTFTSIVKATNGVGTPTGTVAFTIDGFLKATITLDGSGHATYSSNTLAVGSHNVVANYSGSTAFEVSTASLSQSITGVAATPKFSLAAGTYTGTQHVTLSDSTSGAVIHYTTNGSTPTTASATYNTALTVRVSETIKAIAVATGYTQSAIGSAAYVIH